MNEQDIEQAIQAKGLTAPRVTPAHIKALMDRIVYTFDVRPNGSTTTLAHAFLDKHHVSCAETIHQTDYVIENAYGLIEDLAEVVGYYQYPEDAE